MKIIEMERLTLDGKPVKYNPVYENGEDFRDYWCVIETKEEELVYDQFVREVSSNIQDERLMKLWNDMVIHAGLGMGVKLGDDDIYGYIRPDETEPFPTEPYIDGDGDEWVVIG